MPTILITFSKSMLILYHASVEAARQMPEGGRILIIGSVNGDRMPVAGMAAYAASKSSLQGMARGLARDFRAWDHHQRRPARAN